MYEKSTSWDEAPKTISKLSQFKISLPIPDYEESFPISIALESFERSSQKLTIPEKTATSSLQRDKNALEIKVIRISTED